MNRLKIAKRTKIKKKGNQNKKRRIGKEWEGEHAEWKEKKVEEEKEEKKGGIKKGC